MKTSRGFISLGIILIVLISFAVLGGAGYYLANKEAPPNNSISTSFVAIPTSGAAPLSVTFTIKGCGYQINFGDGKSENCMPHPDGPSGKGYNRVLFHVYTSPGTYDATLVEIKGGPTNRVLDTIVITVR